MYVIFSGHNSHVHFTLFTYLTPINSVSGKGDRPVQGRMGRHQ